GSLGGVAMTAMDSSEELTMNVFLVAGYNLFPAVLFFIGLAALALGWAPKLRKVVYVYLIYSVMINYFEGILDLLDWFLNTAVQSWISQMPMESFDASSFITLTVISIVLIIIGYLGYSKRDMFEGT